MEVDKEGIIYVINFDGLGDAWYSIPVLRYLSKITEKKVYVYSCCKPLNPILKRFDFINLIENVYAKDKYTVVVELKKATVIFLLNLAREVSPIYIMPKEIIEGATYKRVTLGYQAGVGIDLLKKLTFDLRYEGSLNQFGDEITILGETFPLDDRTGAIIFHVGYIF